MPDLDVRLAQSLISEATDRVEQAIYRLYMRRLDLHTAYQAFDRDPSNSRCEIGLSLAAQELRDADLEYTAAQTALGSARAARDEAWSRAVRGEE